MAGATHSTTDRTVRSPRMSLAGSAVTSLTHWGRTLASIDRMDTSLLSSVDTSPQSLRSEFPAALVS